MSTTQAQPTLLPRDSYRFDADLSTKQQIAVYWVRSETVEGREYKVRYEFRDDRWYCDCPATVPCKHIYSVRYWGRFRKALADYLAMPVDQLRECDMEFTSLNAGNGWRYDWWEVDSAACGEAIAARWDEMRAYTAAAA